MNPDTFRIGQRVRKMSNRQCYTVIRSGEVYTRVRNYTGREVIIRTDDLAGTGLPDEQV